MIKNVLTILSISILGALIALSLFSQRSESIGGDIWTSSQFSVASTSKVVAVTSDIMLVGSSTSAYQRAYTSICNDSSQVVYLGLNGDKQVTQSNGIRLNAGNCYEITDQNLYTGAIRATSTNETSSNVIINDFTL